MSLSQKYSSVYGQFMSWEHALTKPIVELPLRKVANAKGKKFRSAEISVYQRDIRKSRVGAGAAFQRKCGFYYENPTPKRRLVADRELHPFRHDARNPRQKMFGTLQGLEMLTQTLTSFPADWLTPSHLCCCDGSEEANNKDTIILRFAPCCREPGDFLPRS